MEIIRDLPQGLRRDIKRYLCLDLVKKVSISVSSLSSRSPSPVKEKFLDHAGAIDQQFGRPHPGQHMRQSEANRLLQGRKGKKMKKH